MSRCWCINLYDGDIEMSYSQYKSLGDRSVSFDNTRYVFMHKNSNPILMSALFSTVKKTFYPSSIGISQKFFSASRRALLCSSDTCPLQVSTVIVSPDDLRVLTFHVLTEMFYLTLISLIFGTPETYLSLTSRCLTVDMVIVLPDCDRSGINVLLMLFIMVFPGQRSTSRRPSLSWLLMLPTAEIHDKCMASLRHEHIAVDSKSSSGLALDF